MLYEVITPLKKHHEENVTAIKNELFHRGISVVIERRECIQTAKVTVKIKKEANA